MRYLQQNLNNVSAYTMSTDVVAVAEINAGQFIMVSKDNGAFVNINQNTGTAPGEQRGYTITITVPSEPGFAASGLTA